MNKGKPMSLSLRNLALAAPLSLSALSGIPAAALASEAPERADQLMSIPAFGMVIGILVIAVHGAIGYGIDRAAASRLETEVLHP
jgi:hypothetical protein